MCCMHIVCWCNFATFTCMHVQTRVSKMSSAPSASSQEEAGGAFSFGRCFNVIVQTRQVQLCVWEGQRSKTVVSSLSGGGLGGLIQCKCNGVGACHQYRCASNIYFRVSVYPLTRWALFIHWGWLACKQKWCSVASHQHCIYTRTENMERFTNLRVILAQGPC